jgi:hypothetical protein
MAEAEDFQAVGMRCRECLLELVRALADPALVPAGTEAPKAADFVGWSDLIAGHVAAGSSAEEVRRFLRTKRMLCVRRSEWKGEITAPKNGRFRYVPLTNRLANSLRDHRHLRGPRVICEDDGSALTRQKVQYRMKRAARRANLKHEGVHILRHTFCSHLAMRGAPAKAIQELLGHQDLSMTQRYMHLSPAALDAAIELLDGPQRGDILETAGSSNR